MREENGEYVGKIVAIIPTGSNDVYVARNDSEEFLLPATLEVIMRIGLEKGCVVVHLPEVM